MTLVTFLLCCLVSTLTGTAFGTAATVGVICVAMASSMGIPPVLTGGAVLAGSYFGDRCSPMSTSALLVSELTKTDIFSNIGRMVKTSAVPFVISCAVYFILGLALDVTDSSVDVASVFGTHFSLSPIVLIPVAVIIVLSAFRVSVKIAMALSIAAGFVTTLVTQNVTVFGLLKAMLVGFHPEDAELARPLEGGGIVSMARVFCIVCLSSCYSGIFEETGLLDGIRGYIGILAKKLTPFGATLVTSVVCGMIACNQTLCIMLCDRLCGGLYESDSDRALALENTAVVTAPLIPWSIAGGVPLASVGAPISGMALAVYLWILPLWQFRRRKV